MADCTESVPEVRADDAARADIGGGAGERPRRAGEEASLGCSEDGGTCDREAGPDGGAAPTEEELERIRERFDARPIATARDIADWNAGKIAVGLIHPASAGHGLNLQEGGSTLIWFTPTWSLELYQQTNARLWRQGQRSRTVVIRHIIARGTHDEDVMRALERKDMGQAALIRAVRAQIGGAR